VQRRFAQKNPAYSPVAALARSGTATISQAMFEKCQNAQTTDLFPPRCAAFFCRASARLQKSASIGEKISRHWAFCHLSNKAQKNLKYLLTLRKKTGIIISAVKQKSS
jgi:hypothetical protein